MTTLILVRHGESEANFWGIFAGHFDADLSKRGMEQAKLAASYIKENYKVDLAFASDLKRAFKTGKCIADHIGGLEVTPVKALREIQAGKWDGEKFDDIERIYKNDYAVWRNDIGNACATDGESVKELSERVMAEIEKIAVENDGKTVLIATHSTPIRAIESIVKTGGIEKMKDIPWVSNASVSVLEYNLGKWRFALIGEDKYLDALKTELPKNV